MHQREKFFVSFLAVLIFVLISSQIVFASSATALKNGMSGNSVLRLQKDLKALGYLDVDPTGYYGDITDQAVAAFQKKHGLSSDGIAGKQTIARLNRLMGRTSAPAPEKASLKAAVSVKAETASARAATVSRGDSTTGSLIDFARQFLGVHYVWGGMSPSGFDCSGFVKYVFEKFGVTLDRVSTSMAGEGSRVGKSDLAPGDLVFFDTNGGHNRINHVGIYIGDGKFIQASSDKEGVVISDITGGFYADTYMTARRVLE